MAICSLPRTEFSSSYSPRYLILVTPFIYPFPSIFSPSWGRCSENIFFSSDSHTHFTTWSTFGLLDVVACMLNLRNVGLGSHCLKALPAFRDLQQKRGVLICSLLPVSLCRAWGVCPAPDSAGSGLLRRSPKPLTVPKFFLSAFQGLSETLGQRYLEPQVLAQRKCWGQGLGLPPLIHLVAFGKRLNLDRPQFFHPQNCPPKYQGSRYQIHSNVSFQTFGRVC